MKLTKCCLYPWQFMQIHAGGMMQPCAVGPDTDLGDFLIDYIEKMEMGCKDSPPHVHSAESDVDFLNNKGLQMLREGMLSGNLRPMCQDCFFVSNELITVAEFETRLKSHLKSRLGHELDIEKADLLKTYAYSFMAVSFTNRCNLSCIYCVQSTQKNINPFFKAEIPYKYADQILDMMAEKGIFKLATCVEGEATLYRHWHEVFTRFHQKYPDIELSMTTNFSRKFSDKDMELLSNYSFLDISLDSMNPKKYQQMRRNGNLELVIENLDRLDKTIQKSGMKGPQINLHMVISDKTWEDMEEVAEFAFSRGYEIQLGNYEERVNTVAYQEGLLKPLNEMPEQEQELARDAITRIQKKAKEKNRICIIQGDIFTKVNNTAEKNYHRFSITDGNPVYEAFIKKYPKGEAGKHFSIVYDRDNISYAGIRLCRGESLVLDDLPQNLFIILREVSIYKTGSLSPKYNHSIEPGFRRKIELTDGSLNYQPVFKNDDIDSILIDISEWWIKD